MIVLTQTLDPPLIAEHKLQEHYWKHVELFPHRPIPIGLQIELLDILRHAHGGIDFFTTSSFIFSYLNMFATDRLTSLDSTFPWEENKCDKFIQLITVSNGSGLPLQSCASSLRMRLQIILPHRQFVCLVCNSHKLSFKLDDLMRHVVSSSDLVCDM